MPVLEFPVTADEGRTPRERVVDAARSRITAVERKILPGAFFRRCINNNVPYLCLNPSYRFTIVGLHFVEK